MSAEWINLPTMQEVAEAQKNGWEIETDNAGLVFRTWYGVQWDDSWRFRARPRQPEKKRIVLRRALRYDRVSNYYWATELSTYDYSKCDDFICWLDGEEVVEIKRHE